MRSPAALLLALALALGACSSPPAAPPVAPDGWELVWEEDFEARDAAFDARWSVGTHTFDGNDAQFVADHVVVADGVLTLRLTADATAERRFSGAEIRTHNETGFLRYGRFETRMKAARGSGVISSFFTYRNSPWQEIDIEILGREPDTLHANLFYNAGPAGAANNAPFMVPPFPVKVPLPHDAAEAFHEYAFEWEPGAVRWFVDGRQVAESRDPALTPSLPTQLMMNLWITDAEWAGPRDASVLPVESHYDWVRVYRRAAP